MPRPHIFRLLLHPQDLRSLRIRRQRGAQGGFREWVKLFHAQYGHVFLLDSLALLQKFVKNLARAKQHAADFFDGRRIDEQALKFPGSAVLQARNGARVAQQALGRHDHQRLAPVA